MSFCNIRYSKFLTKDSPWRSIFSTFSLPQWGKVAAQPTDEVY